MSRPVGATRTGTIRYPGLTPWATTFRPVGAKTAGTTMPTNRRTFLADVGLGFTGLALGAMLHRDGFASEARWSPPDGKPHFPPKAKSVIWVFLSGGVSQLESFDPKPALTKYAGKTFTDTPFADP